MVWWGEERVRPFSRQTSHAGLPAVVPSNSRIRIVPQTPYTLPPIQYMPIPTHTHQSTRSHTPTHYRGSERNVSYFIVHYLAPSLPPHASLCCILYYIYIYAHVIHCDATIIIYYTDNSVVALVSHHVTHRDFSVSRYSRQSYVSASRETPPPDLHQRYIILDDGGRLTVAHKPHT